LFDAPAHSGGHDFEPKLSPREALGLIQVAVNSVDDTISAREALSLIRVWVEGVPRLAKSSAVIDPSKPLVFQVTKRKDPL
jgi:hypothetical protein